MLKLLSPLSTNTHQRAKALSIPPANINKQCPHLVKITDNKSVKSVLTLFNVSKLLSCCHCFNPLSAHSLSKGTCPTIKYIGVKIPNSPPLAKPIPPLWSKICVREVPEGAKRRNSITFNVYLVRRRPNQLNWNLCVKGFHDGINGSILISYNNRT